MRRSGSMPLRSSLSSGCLTRSFHPTWRWQENLPGSWAGPSKSPALRERQQRLPCACRRASHRRLPKWTLKHGAATNLNCSTAWHNPTSRRNPTLPVLLIIVFLTGTAKIETKRPTLECELPCTDFHTLSSSPPGCVHPSHAEEAHSQAMMLSASRFLSYRPWQIAPNPTLSSGDA